VHFFISFAIFSVTANEMKKKKKALEIKAADPARRRGAAPGKSCVQIVCSEGI